MIKKFNILLAAAALLSLSSCNREDVVQTDKPSEIRFDQIATKAGLTDLHDNGFGVWAFIDNSSVNNYVLMDNTQVSYNEEDNAWEYSPIAYWMDKTVFTFLAVYPYDEHSTNYTLEAENKTINVELSDTPAQEDYLIAKNETDTSIESFSETVNLEFKHILTSVGLNIWRDGGKHQNDQMRIQKVTLSNIRKAGTYSINTDIWTFSNEKLTLEKVYEGGSDDDNIGAAIVLDNGTLDTGGQAANPFNEMMLIPQTLDAENTVSLSILYELKRNNAADWEQAELETVLPDVTWMPNKRYTYNVVLSSVTDITVYYIQTKVDPWGTPQVGGTVIIK